MLDITINDDLDLEKIESSGQCFRVHHFDDGLFCFVTGEHVLYIRQNEGNSYRISCDEAEWNDAWKPYFDIGRDYSAIRSAVNKNDIFMRNACEFGRGIRILKQDAWEMLISFIISQRKSIPSIRSSVELISLKYGGTIETEYETIHTFPTPAQLIRATSEELSACKLGYRVPYIIDATEKVVSGKLNLTAIDAYDDAALIEELKTVKGVGDKVANCIALFAYGRTSLAPIDTWIRQVIDNEYAGSDPFPGYGSVAGIMQQYAFFYAQGHRGERTKA